MNPNIKTHVRLGADHGRLQLADDEACDVAAFGPLQAHMKKLAAQAANK